MRAERSREGPARPAARQATTTVIAASSSGSAVPRWTRSRLDMAESLRIGTASQQES
ncbi:hypothetical protein Slala05_27230 [Streptomyces lavendulae subsp. lavendulae]|nr:hypothetical protein Slala05_27230 [Streptomyces lavendulae subsp. lavendulae]